MDIRKWGSWLKKKKKTGKKLATLNLAKKKVGKMKKKKNWLKNWLQKKKQKKKTGKKKKTG